VTFKTRIAAYFGLFILLTAALGLGLMVNSYREEKAFHAGRNALRAQFMAQEVDYFVNKKIKSVEAYVMLEEELERYSIQEADGVLDKKFETWERWVKEGDASGPELMQVKDVCAGLKAVQQKISTLMDEDLKVPAIKMVNDEFRPLAKKARERLKGIAERKVQEAVESERQMQKVVRQSHMTSVAGVLLAVILGVVLAMSLYNSVMLPMKVLLMWSDQMAKGHLHVSLDIPGNNEMGRLATNFNEMVQNLSRHNQEQVDKERAKLVLERQKERELEVEKELMHRRKERELEEVNTLEDAVDGFREILDIMGAPAPKSKKKD
jgi:methyl-accepting chemotaxis protein